MLSLHFYKERGLLMPWLPPGDVLPMRYVFYSGQWEKEFKGLQSITRRLGLRRDTSVADWVRGFLDAYVSGAPLGDLIRMDGRGFAMHPTFKRMRPPHQRIVELRTEDTRSFGFFAADGSLVLHRIADVRTLKLPEGGADKAAYARMAASIETGFLHRIPFSEIDVTTNVETLPHAVS